MNVIGDIFCALGQGLGGCRLERELPTLDYTVEKDIYEISSILIDLFPETPLYLPDNYYKTCTREDVKRFLANDLTSREQYQPEVFDCDDFAWRLKGNITVPPWSALPFFVVWTDKHALNGFIDSDGRWWFVEPQNNEISESLADWQGSEIRFIAG